MPTLHCCYFSVSCFRQMSALFEPNSFQLMFSSAEKVSLFEILAYVSQAKSLLLTLIDALCRSSFFDVLFSIFLYYFYSCAFKFASTIALFSTAISSSSRFLLLGIKPVFVDVACELLDVPFENNKKDQDKQSPIKLSCVKQ